MDAEELKQQWLLQNKKVCLCRGIPRKRIVAVIQSGASSVEDVNRSAGSGSGGCGGTRCGPVIQRLLEEMGT